MIKIKLMIIQLITFIILLDLKVVELHIDFNKYPIFQILLINLMEQKFIFILKLLKLLMHIPKMIAHFFLFHLEKNQVISTKILIQIQMAQL